ncbi:MAG: SDR family oxidoreductase [Anaerolineales bacterium]
MQLLILGGTVFLGRHFVEAALAAGHEVTLFNRGETNPDLFPGLEKLRGERPGDLEALKGENWDAVIDTSGYTPEAVRGTARLLSGSVKHYTFISTISVYRDGNNSGLTEEALTATLPEGEAEDQVTGETYGPLKALCEKTVRSKFEGEVLILRPGLIVGPHDPTGRFTYWPRRMSRGGEVLAPGDPDRPVQLIDARDLASWTIESIEDGLKGTLNATGPATVLTMKEMLKTCRQAGENDAELTWVDDRFLIETGVQPFTEMPLWLPEGQNGLMEVNIDRALDAGLTFRPLLDTATDTLTWDQELGGTIRHGPAMGPARELALLEAWHAKKDSGD